jgi:type II secretory pathway pseudopilin PulG
VAQFYKLRCREAQVANLRYDEGADAFTVIEMTTVISIILVLAGLILGTSSYVHNKGARARAEAEIAAMSAALENYKADNGVYPASSLLPTETNPSNYETASKSLYGALAGDTDANGTPGPGASYMIFRPDQLGGTGAGTYLRDPFENSYGYSTLGPTGGGFNPTFDLWSIADGKLGSDQTKWVKNW